MAQRSIESAADSRKTIIILSVLPIFLNLVVEILSRGSVLGGCHYFFTHLIPFFCNSLIILCTLVPILLLKRRIFAGALISVVWVLLGVVNMVLLHCRVTPFNASDLRQIDSALSTADKYFNRFTFFLMSAGVIGVAAVLAVLFLKAPVIGYKIRYLQNLIVIGLVWVFTACAVNISIDTGFLSMRFSNLTDAYERYGFVYCFGNSLVNTGVQKPSDYSEERIDQIIWSIKKKEQNKEKVRTPNIIFLQLESFFDLTKMKGIKLSKDPIPTFRSLKENYSSGYLNVYNVGYGTSNTEFEIITGMNLDDFGPGEFPYRTVLQNTTCESICYNLKESGYRTHGIHNNKGTFYSRDIVFANLGFDTFTSIEYMNNVEYTPVGWAKDNCLVEEILKAMKTTKEKDYIYAISVQGHGSYPAVETYENPQILVSGIEDEGRKNAFEYYANEIYEMDMFVAELISELEQQQEEVVLVMYGDHLPGLGISEEDLENGSVYQTEYVIWDNFGLKQKNEDIEAFQLSSKVLGSLHNSEGVINSFHQNYRHSEEYLSRLQNLEYDILYGALAVYDGENPYKPTQIKMGSQDIVIRDLQAQKEGVFYVDGENFTPYSVVYVNGEQYHTEFVSSGRLQIDYEDPEDMDAFVVAQVTEDDEILSETRTYIYHSENADDKRQETGKDNQEN